jgi:uncharacterized repeat protein (TIGR01451 family)
MKSFDFSLFAALFLLSFSSINIAAADVATTVNSASKVEAKLTGFKITRDVGNKEVLSSADKVAPGDLLIYQVVYQNNGKSLLKQLTATLPLPIGTTYVAESARPANVTASLDGKEFAVMPLKRLVKKADGKFEEQAIPLAEYRALRWELGTLAEKNKVEVSARARVNHLVLRLSKIYTVEVLK